MKRLYCHTWLVIIIFFMSVSVVTPPVEASSGEIVISGKTMGTYYRIKYIDPQNRPVSDWEKKVTVCLKDINKKMSMFDPKSELSDFNRQLAEKPFRLSSNFNELLLFAEQLHTMTGGAWDGTIKPLVDLWGFGSKKHKKEVPDKALIEAALQNVGFNRITFLKERQVIKKTMVTLDLSSIAKGYGVDKVAQLFLQNGVKNILVDIGGELFASGRNAGGHIWAVAITRPNKKQYSPAPYAVVMLNNMAIATSGDYRNFFRQDGKTYSHIIDPRNGFPVKNQVTSASVIAPDCMAADGLATALMVMDIHESIALIDRLENTECMIISVKNGKLISHTSKNFDAFVRH